jgi:hypothetical protein
MLYYVAGGLITGLILFIILMIATGGFNNFISGVQGIFLNQYYGETSLGISLITRFPRNFMLAVRQQSLEFFVALYFLLIYIFRKIRLRVPLSILAIAFSALYALIFVWWVHGTRETHSQIHFAFLTGGILPLGLYFLTDKHKKEFLNLFIILYIPSIFGFALISAASAGAHLQSPWMMIGGIILSAIYIVLLLQEYLSKRTVLPLLIVSCLLFSISNVFMHYNVVYRDSPVRELNYRVEYGIYKGIRTTAQRRMLVENTERLIKEADREGKNVMAMENAPFAYLMSDMQPSVPTLWAPTFYHIKELEMSDSTQVLAYYSVPSRMPDIIFFFYPANYMYGEDPNYDLHAWLKKNYRIIQDHTNNSENIPFWLLERIQ